MLRFGVLGWRTTTCTPVPFEPVPAAATPGVLTLPSIVSKAPFDDEPDCVVPVEPEVLEFEPGVELELPLLLMPELFPFVPTLALTPGWPLEFELPTVMPTWPEALGR